MEHIDVVNPVCIVTAWFVDKLPVPSGECWSLTSDYSVNQFIRRWKASFVVPLLNESISRLAFITWKLTLVRQVSQ